MLLPFFSAINTVLPANTYAPKFVQFLTAHLPQKLQCSFYNLTLNKIFKSQINDEELAFLNNKWLAINVTDIALTFYFTLQGHKIISSLIKQPATVEIKGAFDSFMLLSSQQFDADTLFFQRKLQITGDTELGLQIKNLLDGVELEQLPRILTEVIQLYGKQQPTSGSLNV